MNKINSELETLQKELAQFKSTVDYLNSAEENVKSAVESVSQSKSLFSKKTEELKNTYKSYADLTNRIEDFLSKVDKIDFPTRLEVIEKTVASTVSNLEETKSATIDELNKASEKIVNADFAGQFKKLQQNVGSSIESNKSLAESIIDLNLNNSYDTINKQIDNLNSTILSLKADIKKVLDYHKFTDNKIDKLSKDVGSVQTDINTISRDISTLNNDTKNSIKLINNLQTDIDSSSNKIVDIKKETNTISKKVDEVSSRIDKIDKRSNVVVIFTIVIAIILLIILIK